MSKFVIECPQCGKYAEAKIGFFARKKIDCSCGYTINVRTDKLTGRECPHCGNMVVFDQSKGEKALCPVCHEPINTQAEQSKMEEFSCAQCGIRLRTSKAADTYICPVCDCVNDVRERLLSEKIKKGGLASIINTKETMRRWCGSIPLRILTWVPSSSSMKAKMQSSSGTVRHWICSAQAAIPWRHSSFPYWKSSITCLLTHRGHSIPRSTISTKQCRWLSSGGRRTRFASLIR